MGHRMTFISDMIGAMSTEHESLLSNSEQIHVLRRAARFDRLHEIVPHTATRYPQQPPLTS